jgi:hypothetical protein
MIQLLLIKLSNWLVGEPVVKRKRIVKFKKVIKKGKKFIWLQIELANVFFGYQEDSVLYSNNVSVLR